ncbi:hypothetical protein [Algiphilus sp.]|uniref:hypothetical protein n=1 Tax=Algiphilus sp. TaxID=1872431 RepID=UPI003C35DF88
MIRMRPTLLLALALVAPAAAMEPAMEQWVSDDSDGATQYRVTADGSTAIGDGDTAVNGGLGYWHLHEPGDSTAFGLARVGVEHRPDTATRLRARATQLSGSRWSPLLGEALLTHDFRAPLYLELSASRGIIDTLAAIDRRWDLRSTGVSLDLGPWRGITLVGGYTRQWLGDDNRRGIAVGRLLIEPTADQRWLVELRSRLLRSDFDAAGYFSPRRMDEHLLLGTYRRPVLGDRWYVSIELGGGTQRVNRGEQKALYHAELVWRGWFNDHVGLESRAACMNSGGLDAGPAGDGYRYCQGTVTLKGSW